MNDVYKNIEQYSPNKKCKIFIVCEDMTANMLNNRNLEPKVTELFIRNIKLNIFIVFNMQYYLAVLKNITLTSTHYFMMKILNQREL